MILSSFCNYVELTSGLAQDEENLGRKTPRMKKNCGPSGMIHNTLCWENIDCSFFATEFGVKKLAAIRCRKSALN